MAKIVNINIANLEELMSIKDIGEARAKKILQARTDKGVLTLDDVKSIHGIPDTLWDPLVVSGRITFDTPQDLVKFNRELKQQIDSLKLELATQKQEHKQEIKNYEGEIEEFEKRNQELQQKFSVETDAANEFHNQEKQKLTIQIDQEKEVNKKNTAIIDKANAELAKAKDKLKLFIQDKSDTKELIDSMQMKFDKEKKLLEDKIIHYCGVIDEEQAENKHLNQKCSKLEDELKHSIMSKKVTETIEKHEISSRKTKSPDNEPEKMSTRYDKSSSQQHERSNTSGEPAPPKLSYYDGKSEWKPYYMQFVHFANRYKWDNKQRLDKLLACLKDKALKFYSTRPVSIQNDFALLSEKMNQRFGNKDLPYTIRRQLSEAKQNIDETVEEFAERIQEMACDGYGPTTPENVIETISVDAFLKGCVNARAALFAMEKNPTTLDNALQCVKSSIHNQKVLLGKRHEIVKRVQFDSDVDSDSETSDLAVRMMNQNDKRQNFDRMSSWKSTVDTRLKKTEDDITDIKQNVSKILEAVSRRTSGSPNRRYISPNRNTVRSNDECFKCHELGHFARDCPNAAVVAKIPRSPSPKPKEYTLNNQGSKM